MKGRPFKFEKQLKDETYVFCLNKFIAEVKRGKKLLYKDGSVGVVYTRAVLKLCESPSEVRGRKNSNMIHVLEENIGELFAFYDYIIIDAFGFLVQKH